MHTAAHHTPAPSRERRGGFSLLELLVVVGIIAFLISISGVMYANFVESAREKATSATIKKIHEILQQRIAAFERYVDQQNLRPGHPAIAAKRTVLQNEFGITQVSDAALEILVRKDFYRQAFPQRNDELDTSLGTNVESAEVLYAMLTRGASFGATPVDLDAFSTKEIRDTDGDGLMEFTDAWGRPLRFYRWPTRLIRPGGPPSPPPPPAPAPNRQLASLLIQGLPAPSTPDPLYEDPDDQIGRLTPLPAAAFGESDTPTPSPPPNILYFAYHTRDTYHVPLIVSAGPDGHLGLFEPEDTANFGHLAMPGGPGLDWSDPAQQSTIIEQLSDNITNRNQRAGG